MAQADHIDPHPIVSQMRPSCEQLPAVTARGRDIAVTAGAGAGKTRTLVARYLSLLAEDVPLRSIVAITFTKKAAREMRNRVRDEIRRYLGQANLSARECERWQALYAELDVARINTIHGLCTEILRAHPAEAGIDPRFTVLDEGPATLLRAQVLDETLAWAANNPQAVALFLELKERELRKLLSALLEKRPDIGVALAAPGDDPLSYWERLLRIRSGACLLPLDADQATRLPLLRAAFAFATRRYAALKDERDALDFDDLEIGALAVLRARPDVLVRWQTETQAILVDEFQDTNGRQRDLVRLLNGEGGKLFIVGDAKQSIYRFRGAEVSVFRAEREAISSNGGSAFGLDKSYRAHRALVQGLNDLLRPVLGEQADPARPWVEPFAPLDHHREEAGLGFCAPHIELHLTIGTKSSGALDRAAAALASYLYAMVESKHFTSIRDGKHEPLTYGDIAVLCRASGSFPAYEDALEAAGIPYLTVAGGGFYGRPEIRDLLNALKALADPTDDLALSGLLRSPVFALSDAALYRLVVEHPVAEVPPQGLTTQGPPVSCATLWDRLQRYGGSLPGEDGRRAARAARLIADLHALSGRVTVADLLKAFLDATDYQAALHKIGRTRAARNLSKLLSDAQTSRIVGVGEFLEYVMSLEETGTREGEARAVAEGAVQIMSVHQAKGLEFPVVVIGDALYERRGRDELIIHPELGVLLPPETDAKNQSAVYALAKTWDQDQEDAESNRLLYVAATRAQEKLIVSGCVRLKKDGTPGWLSGWLGKIAALHVLNLANTRLPHNAAGSKANRLTLTLGGQTPVDCTVYEPAYPTEGRAQSDAAPPKAKMATLPPPLLAPVLLERIQVDRRTAESDRIPAQRVWRVVPDVRRPKAPAWVVGSMVHEALAAWRFPDETFDGWSAVRAHNYGLTDAEQVALAVSETRKLLLHFEQHPLHSEMESADKRLHEVPYSLALDGHVESGVIDALYLRDRVWNIVEFKTDEISNAAELDALLTHEDYLAQAERYGVAVEHLLGHRPRTLLCLLDYAGVVLLHPTAG